MKFPEDDPAFTIEFPAGTGLTRWIKKGPFSARWPMTIPIPFR